jgi:hypothetical protein
MARRLSHVRIVAGRRLRAESLTARPMYRRLLMWIKVGGPVEDTLDRFIQSGRFDMSAITKSEMISRRKAVSLMGLAAAFGFAAAPTILAVSDAEAQTVGMERRQARRDDRHQRRDDRRTGRTERREERRTGTAATMPAGTTTGQAK